MEPFKQHFVQDLTQTIKDRHCGSIVFNADNESNVVSVSLFNGSEPVAISGSVVGSVICPDGATVPLTGSYSGNTASVTLTGDCFAVIGQISVGIQIVNGTQKITVLKAYYDVEALTTENVVDPGSRITLEVGDLIAAIDEAVATIPEDYSALTSEVEGIKAVNKIFNRDVVGVPNPIDTVTWIDNANLNDSGATKAAQDWKVTEGYIETSADSYKISYNNSETLYIVQVAGYTYNGSFVRMFANADSGSGVRSFTIDTTSVDKIRIATRYGNPILSVYPNDGKIVEKLASVEDDVSDLKSVVAYQNGSYDNLTSGNAEQLLSMTGMTDKVPYLFRPSAGDGADRAQEKIVGGTVAWNQIADEVSTSFVLLKSGERTKNWSTKLTKSRNGHVYMLSTKLSDVIQSSVENTNFLGFEYGKNVNTIPLTAGEHAVVYKATTQDSVADNSIYFYLANNASDTTTCALSNTQLFDLTAMFGSSIADYVYALESATAGSGIVLLQSWGCFTQPYYAYNAGELLSVNTSGHEMRDASNNIIASYPLDSNITLRGIPKLDANNLLYYDGDTYEADGTVSRRYGIVDLGTLNWSKGEFNNNVRFNCTLEDSGYSGAGAFYGVLSDKYVTHSDPIGANNMDKVGIGYIASGKLLYYFRDSAYDNMTAAEVKTALSGSMLVYELATPTTETADPFQTPQILDPNGTEAYIDSRAIPIPVGHETFYPQNLRSKIEGLPANFSTLIAPTEQTYTATQAYSSGALFIVSNILYKATTSIANGATITPGTNCTATTLAAVIAALA